jgi:hypothetical protein
VLCAHALMAGLFIGLHQLSLRISQLSVSKSVVVLIDSLICVICAAVLCVLCMHATDGLPGISKTLTT